MSKRSEAKRLLDRFVGTLKWGFLSLLIGVAGCAGPSEVSQKVAEGVAQNDGLNSTLWSLESAEYNATALTIYKLAETAVTTGLTDSEWTALPEQAKHDGYRDLPPAVVLDVDETVLDNGEYQARLVVENETYSSDSWLDWVLKERAGPIPGALAFTQKADEMGVTVIYVTNRRGNMEEATRRNLADLGFPVDTTFDVVLTRGERPEWRGGDKTGRRNLVADHFRVLALVGDNLGDFVEVDPGSPAHREEAVVATKALWGSKWFMLPNPQYGSWESAAFNARFNLSPDDRRRLKMEHLRKLIEH